MNAAAIERHLQGLDQRFVPRTLNHTRFYIDRAFEKARQQGRWFGTNSAADVARRKMPKRVPTFLRPEQARAVIAHLPEQRHAFCSTALYTGLRRPDIDLGRRTIHVRWSYDRDITKGGHEDVIPLLKDLVPWLLIALQKAPGQLVFPDTRVGTSFKSETLHGAL